MGLALKRAAAEAARSRSEPASAARAGHPARGGRLTPQRQAGHGARQPDDDSAQEQLGNHREDASRSTSPSI